MLGLQILDLVIGLVFIYFLLSLVCSTVQEIVANLRNLRFKVLESWVLRTFQHNSFGQQILNHPVIQGLTATGKPSYIPSDKFAQVVLDMVHSQVQGDKPFDINSLRDALEKTMLLPPPLRRFILQSITEANGEITKVRGDLARWYDDAMERLGGYYKKKVQTVIILVAVIVAFAFNADTIRIAKFLYYNPEASRQLADQASHVVSDTTLLRKVNDAIQLKSDTLKKDSEVALKEIQADLEDIKVLSAKIYDTKLPLGWRGDTWSEVDLGWLEKLAGLIVTAMAVSLGAPFWFEMLNKLVNLRNAGNKPKSA
jgi:hypothetical protein